MVDLLHDLKQVAELSEKATPGIVRLHTSCSWRRILTDSHPQRCFLVPTRDTDGHPNMDSTENAEFVVALVNFFRTYSGILERLAVANTKPVVGVDYADGEDQIAIAVGCATQVGNLHIGHIDHLTDEELIQGAVIYRWLRERAWFVDAASRIYLENKPWDEKPSPDWDEVEQAILKAMATEGC